MMECMHDVIAVRVSLDNGEYRYFLTWGRVFDAIDSTRICDAVLSYALHCDLGSGKAKAAELCYSLRDASSEEYFYESLFEMACTGGPKIGPEHVAWLEERRHALEDGREIWYLGTPRSRQ